MQVSISSITIPPGQTPGTQLEGSKYPPPGTITVYKSPPFGTERGVERPHPRDIKLENFTNTQFCRIKGCGGAGCPPPPPPIIFERLKLLQQIIYRREGNLSESPNHQKYWENILISRFYEQFSRSSRILGHFWKFEKISNS